MTAKLAVIALPLLALLANLFIPVYVAAQGGQAQPGLHVEISPLPIQLSAKPGTSVSANLRIRNSGSNDERLKLSLKTYSAEGPNGTVVLHDPTPADEFLNWVSLSPRVFNAPAGQWKTVKMSVSLPKGAAFGYYYAVQVELANPPKAKPGVTSLQGAAVMFVLLNAEAPGEKRQAQVESFTADHKIYEFLPVNFSVRVHNSGNVHVAPHGNIFIKRGNSQIAVIPVNAIQGNVLPGANRLLSSAWRDGFPVYENALDDSGQPVKDDNGQVKQKLKWDISKLADLRFGHYSADLVLVYNDGAKDVAINGSLSFWVIPWRLMAAVFVAGILILLGIWSIFGRSVRAVSSKGRRRGKQMSKIKEDRQANGKNS